MRTCKKIVFLAVLALTSAGCSVYRDYTSNAREVLDSLYVGNSYEIASCDTTTVADISWRDFFCDDCLRRLIDTALVNNADINAARLRVIEAQALLKAARRAYIPSVSFSPSINYQFSKPRYEGSAYSYSIPVDASWEIDFGGMFNRRRRAQAALESSENYVNSVQTELVASVAEYYYTLLKLDAQMEISRSTSESWSENVRIMKAMKEAGMTNEASVAQTEANACSIEASLFDLEYQIGECERALCVLAGISPVHLERMSIGESSTYPGLEYGIPVQMLSRRADVKNAENDMRIAYYDTQIARAAFYPSVRISPSAAWDKSITSPAGWLISLFAGVVQPLFARGTIKANLTAAQARQEVAATAFRQVILKAGSEVSNALALCESAQGKADARTRQIAALESAVTSTRALMRHSESTYLEVLTAQQSLLSAQLLQISDRYDMLRGTVSLYRALGGGAM